MQILVTLNAGYLQPLCVMLQSLVKTNPRTSFDIYVAHTDLTDADFEKIGAAVEGSGSRVLSVRVPAELFYDAPILKRTAKETYYRLFAAAYLPEDLDRILYIDPDTLIIGDITPLYTVDFQGNLFAGCGHLAPFVNFINTARLGMDIQRTYINAGVLLINLQALRQVFSPEQVFALIRRRRHTLYLADQDVLNVLYGDRILALDAYLWNLDERCFARLASEIGKKEAWRFLQEKTVVVHYNGKYKPWRANYHGSLDILYPSNYRAIQAPSIQAVK